MYGYETKAVTNGEHDEMMRDQRTALNSMAISMKRANMIAGIKDLYSIGAISEIDYRDSLAFLLEREGIEVTKHLIKKDSEKA